MINIVCGPPGGGKTTFAKKNARWGDLIIDLDAILSAISGLEFYEKPETLLPLGLEIKDWLIDEAEFGEWANAWIISTLPGSNDRKALQRRFTEAQVVVLETPYYECLRRITNDSRRKEKANMWEPFVKRWWDEYTKSSSDIVIRA